jgi:hypothetical protein
MIGLAADGLPGCVDCVDIVVAPAVVVSNGDMARPSRSSRRLVDTGPKISVDPTWSTPHVQDWFPLAIPWLYRGTSRRSASEIDFAN